MAPGPDDSPLPQLQGRPMVTDGGLETDLISHHGADLPHFAAFPLLDSDRGRALLADYYDGYAAIARRAGAGLVLESPTWRATPGWGARLGYSPAELAQSTPARSRCWPGCGTATRPTSPKSSCRASPASPICRYADMRPLPWLCPCCPRPDAKAVV